MALFFEKLGKESKDLVGKGFNAGYQCKYATTAVEGLEFESDTTQNGDALKTVTSFKLCDGAGMDVKYTFEQPSGKDRKFSFESNYDMAKVADIAGLKLQLTGNNACSLAVKADYEYDMFRLQSKVKLGENNGALTKVVEFNVAGGQDGISAGLSFADLLNVAAPVVALQYLEKKNVAAALTLSGLDKDASKPAIKVQAAYWASPELTLAMMMSVKDLDFAKGAAAAQVVAEYKCNDWTTTKVLLSQANAKSGTKMALRKGCDLSVFLALAEPLAGKVDSTALGFALEISA